MAKILFTWELGAGSGHIAPYTNLVNMLESQGHEIYYILKYLNQAHPFFKDTKVTYFQAPGEYRPVIARIRNTNSAAKILFNAGHGDVDYLTAFIKAWRNLYSAINPDLIIFDYSPTAMFAARDTGAKLLAIGTGFHLPPDMNPIPTIWNELGVKKDDKNEVLVFEKKMVKNINEAAERNDITPINHFYELYGADRKIFRTYEEMDHYSGRENAHYSGVLKSAPGAPPEWPDSPGPKIFAYLKPFKTLPKLLEKIKNKGFPTLIYGDGLSQKLVKEFACKSMVFSEKRLDMDTIGKTADLAICNAGHSASCELLLSGKPLLLLPLNLEQHMVANNIEKLGAGLTAKKLTPEGMVQKLKTLLHEDKYRLAAEDFAKKYKDQDQNQMVNDISDTINDLIKNSG